MATVYLMRHAESSSNVEFSVDKDGDIKDTELSELGKEQIRRVANVWKDVKFGRVYSSDFKRAVETAEGILNGQDGEIYENGGLGRPEVEIDEGLREMDFGKLNTASYEEITLHYLSLNEPYFQWKYPSGETVLDAGKRMLTFLEKSCTNLLKSELNSVDNLNILIVSHRVLIAALLYLLGSVPVDGVGSGWFVENLDIERDIRLLNNTGYYKLEIRMVNGLGLRMKVIEKHVVSHLDEIEYGKFGEVMRKKGNEQRLRERLLEDASEKGRKVMGCSQQ